jgi:hypothetical protein
MVAKRIENREGKQVDDNIDDLGRDVNEPKRRPGDVDVHKIKPRTVKPGEPGDMDRDTEGGQI